MPSQNYINHIVFVLDASPSMGFGRKDEELIRVADAEIARLAQRSKELDQETRVTVYTFNTTAQCVIYDMDVLRLPSIREHYRMDGMTALIDASLLAIEDLAMTPEKYGDHAFLVYVLTDGQENRSRHTAQELARRIHLLPDNWTMAVMVPDQQGKFEAKRFGFPADNIAVWDATSRQGVIEAGTVLSQATDRFMEGRAKGVRGTRSVFSTGAEAVNADAVRAFDLKPLPSTSYALVPIPLETSIKAFVEQCGYVYQVGRAYYQLNKTETIQPQKAVAVVDKVTHQVFTGPQARDLLGLPQMSVRVKPDYNPQYDVFVQSTSVNRKLLPGSRLLILL